MLISTSAFSTAAQADASPAEREIARSAMQSGDELRSTGDQRAALKHYRAAHAIMHVPTTGLAVAQMEFALGLLLEARSTAMEVINLPGEADESAIFAKARAAAAGLAARLRPLIPSIAVDVSPEDIPYTVAIDGVEISVATRQLPLKANPGIHRLEVSAQGYVTEARDLTLVEGEQEPARVRFELVAVQPAPPSAAASVTLVAAEPARAPAPRAKAPTADVVASTDAAGTRALIGFSVGGAILLGGAAAGIASSLKTAQIMDDCDDGYCGESRRGSLRTANTLANIANIAIPAGVLGIAYGLYELMSAPDLDAKEHAAVEVRWVGPQTVGVFW